MLIKALAVILWTVAIGVFCIMSTMVIYVLKQARWDANLKRYKVDGTDVINRQGVRISTPSELLKELQGIEERIAK